MKFILSIAAFATLFSLSVFAEEASSDAVPSSTLGEFQSPKNCAQESTASSISLGIPETETKIPDFNGKKAGKGN